MHYNEQEILEKLLAHAEKINIEKTEAETNALNSVFKQAAAFRKSLTTSQSPLFSQYVESLSDYTAILSKEAFIKGVKFATAYLAKSADNN